MAQKLSNLANKSKVKFGSLYGSPIVWIVADKNHAGYAAKIKHAQKDFLTSQGIHAIID